MLEYTLADYDPLIDGDEVEWARRLDEQGWRTWHGTGVRVNVNGRGAKCWSLRRKPSAPLQSRGVPAAGRTTGEAVRASRPDGP
ncbi:hypothetical protein [Knoellia subterranea]|nr:hypothetical protein [Knoellia subterranea]